MRRSLDLVILHPTLGVLAVMDAACRPGLVGPAGDVDARDVYAEPGTPVATPGIVGVGFVEGAFACLIDTHLYDVAFDARQALLRVADFSANEIRHGGGEPVATFALRSLFLANEVRPRRRRLGGLSRPAVRSLFIVRHLLPDIIRQPAKIVTFSLWGRVRSPLFCSPCLPPLFCARSSVFVGHHSQHVGWQRALDVVGQASSQISRCHAAVQRQYADGSIWRVSQQQVLPALLRLRRSQGFQTRW